jgi:predicted ribonuclease YlaK
MTPSGWQKMETADKLVTASGEVVAVISKEKIGIQDSYDVSLDYPHTYITANGLVHHNTFLALYRAIEEVLQKDNPFQEVVIVRSTVQTRDVGFLPGSLEEKQEIFELPYKEICTTLFSRPDAYQRLKEQGYIRFISTTAIRGISVDNAIIIVDEIQNMNWGELSTVLTRVGHRSKIIFCGDKFQNDLTKSKNDVSGLSQFLEVAKLMPAFQEIVFTPDDIIRSSLVRDFILACEKKGIIPS